MWSKWKWKGYLRFIPNDNNILFPKYLHLIPDVLFWKLIFYLPSEQIKAKLLNSIFNGELPSSTFPMTTSDRHQIIYD